MIWPRVADHLTVAPASIPEGTRSVEVRGARRPWLYPLAFAATLALALVLRLVRLDETRSGWDEESS